MKKKRDLTRGSIYKNLLWVAIPTLLSSLVQMAYNLTDMYWVGKLTYGKQAIAAISVGGFYMWFGFGLIMLVKIGTSVKVSHAAGIDDHEEVERIGNTGSVLMLAVGIIYSLIGIYAGNLFVDFFEFDSIFLVDMAYQYLGIISLFIAINFLANLFHGIYDGLGLTLMTFFVSATGLIINIFLDPFFIHESISIFGMTLNGLGLGVSGAAFATVLSQGVILLIYIIIYIGKNRPFHLHPFKYFNTESMRKILRVGYPVALQSLLFTIIAIIVTKMQADFHDDIVTTQRLGSQIEAVAWMIASGFQVALASFVGQNYAAGKIDRVKQGYLASMKILVPYGIVVNVLMFLFARQIFGTFLADPTTIDYGTTYLRVLSFSQLFMILELSTAGAFNGLGKTEYPSTVSIAGNILRIPGAMLLAIPLAHVGIWWAISLSSVIKGTVLVFLFVWYYRKHFTQDTTQLEIA